MASSRATTVPLSAQLSQVWIAYTIEADNVFEEKGAAAVGDRFRISLPLWTNGLRFIDEEGVSVGDLRAGAGAACNLGGLERWGWITVGPSGPRRDGFGTHRKINLDTVLRPTRAGTYARELWPEVVAEVEERWRARFGTSVVAELRGALDVVTTPMPWSPPEVQPGDGFRTHVFARLQADGEPPLVALLGMALVQLTLRHEEQSVVSLPLGADVLRVVGDGAPSVRDLPARSGISKEAVAMAANFMIRQGLAVKDGPSIRLTPIGADALDDYRARAAKPHDPRLTAALAAVRDQQEALSAGLKPPEGCWRGDRPYLAQTLRVLSDPTGTLPWHPIVLHRGSWPDGS